MIEAYDVSSVRAAEGAAMRELPEGTLMDRAARGLAAVVGGPAPRARAAAASSPSSAAGTTVVTPCTPSPRWPRRAWPPPCVTVSEHPHAAGLEAVTAAGVEVVASLGEQADPRAVELVQEADVVLDGVLGIGGRPGLPPAAEAVVRAVPDDVDGRRGRPAERRRPGRRGLGARDGVRGRDGHLRDGQAGAPAAGDGAGGRGAHRGRHRRRAGRGAVRAAAHATTTWPPCGRCPDRPTTSTPAGCSASSPAARATPARRCSASRPPWRPAPGWCATSAADPHHADPHRRAGGGARGRTGAGVAGRPGPGPRRRHRARPGPARRRARGARLGGAVRRGRRRRSSCSSAGPDPRRPCSRRTPASWPGC